MPVWDIVLWAFTAIIVIAHFHIPFKRGTLIVHDIIPAHVFALIAFSFAAANGSSLRITKLLSPYNLSGTWDTDSVCHLPVHGCKTKVQRSFKRDIDLFQMYSSSTKPIWFVSCDLFTALICSIITIDGFARPERPHPR